MDGNTSSTKTWTWQQSTTYVNDWHVSGTFEDTFGVGTIQNTVTKHTVTVSVSSALQTQLLNVFTTTYQKGFYNNKSYTYNNVDKFSQGALFANESTRSYIFGNYGIFGMCAEEYDGNHDILLSAQFNKLKSCLQATAIDLVITITTEMQYGDTVTATYNVNIADSSLRTLATSVNLDNTGIVF